MADPARLLLSILAIGVSLVAGTCKTGRALDDGGDCYTLLWNVTHADAKAQCSKLGGLLGSVHSADMNKKILDWSVEELKTWKGLDLTQRYTTLLGASSIQTATYNYAWTDGSTMNYTNWAHQLMDNQDRNGFCLQVYTKGHMDGNWTGKWQDLSCKWETHAVCEKDKPCSGDWKAGEGTNKCYTSTFPAEPAVAQEPKPMAYAEADKICKDKSGRLPILHSEAESNAVLGALDKRAGSAWLGATRTKGMEEELTWDDGTSVDYTNWMDLEPNNYDKDARNVNHDPVPGQENCIHLRLSRQDDKEEKPLVGQWEQHVCQPDRYALALCKLTITPPTQGPNNGVTGATSGQVGPSKGTNPGQGTGATLDPLAPSQDPNSGQVSGGTPDPNAPSKDPNAGPNGGTTPVNGPSKGGGGGGGAGTTPVPAAPSKDPSK